MTFWEFFDIQIPGIYGDKPFFIIDLDNIVFAGIGIGEKVETIYRVYRVKQIFTIQKQGTYYFPFGRIKFQITLLSKKDIYWKE